MHGVGGAVVAWRSQTRTHTARTVSPAQRWYAVAAQLSAHVDKRRRPFTAEENALLEKYGPESTGEDAEELQESFGIHLTRKSMRTLNPEGWLDDKIINTWFELLQERSLAKAKYDASALDLFMTTQFIEWLLVNGNSYCYENVKRWNRPELIKKKCEQATTVFDFARVFIPVHVDGGHWCLAVVFMRQRVVQYYDSNNPEGGKGRKYLRAIKHWLANECMTYLKKPLEPRAGGNEGGGADACWGGTWKLVKSQTATPQQENGCDCGVFTCIAADFLSDVAASAGPAANNNCGALQYSQADMEHFRQRIAVRLLQGEDSLVKEAGITNHK